MDQLGDPEFQIWLTHTPQDEGHEYAGTAISMYTHTGTTVLLDVAGTRGVECLPESYTITRTDLIQAGSEQLRRGDVALVRTGRMSYWHDRERFMSRPPGLGIEAARHLAEEREVMCVGLDCGGEVLPPEQPDTFLPVYSYLLSDMGVPIIDNMWLEEFAQAALSEVMLLAFPLKLRGSTGQPVRPIAMPRA